MIIQPYKEGDWKKLDPIVSPKTGVNEDFLKLSLFEKEKMVGVFGFRKRGTLLHIGAIFDKAMKKKVIKVVKISRALLNYFLYRENCSRAITMVGKEYKPWAELVGFKEVA